MDGDEEIGFVAVRKPGPIFQLNKDITVSGHQHTHAGLLSQEFTKLEPYLESNVLLLGPLQPPCARIFSPMAGIDHDGCISLSAWRDGLGGGRSCPLRDFSWVKRGRRDWGVGWSHINDQARRMGKREVLIGPERCGWKRHRDSMRGQLSDDEG